MDVTYQLQQKGLDVTQTGLGSARNVREFLYHPDDIKILQTGDGIFCQEMNIFTVKSRLISHFRRTYYD